MIKISSLVIALAIFSLGSASAQAIYWAQTYGGLKKDKGRDIGMDGNGNCYIAGFFTDKAEFGNGVAVEVTGGSDDEDIFILKCDQEGKALWARSMGNGFDTHTDFPFGFSTNKAGYSAMTGNCKNYLQIDDGTYIPGIGDNDMVLVLFDPDGNVIWAKVGGGMGPDMGTGVYLADDNSIYCTGNANGDFSLFGDTSLNQGNQHHTYIAKYNLNGKLEWANDYSSGANFEARDITVDKNGSVYVGGNFANTINIEGTSLTAVGENDGWLIKITSNGELKWVKSFYSSEPGSWEGAYTLACDTFSNLYVATVFDQDIAFDGNITFTGLQQNIAVAAFNPDGVYKWAEVIKASDGQGQFSVYCLGLYGGDNVILTGCFSGEAKFGMNEDVILMPYNDDPAYADAFLAAFSPSNGSPAWAIHMGGEESDAGYGIAGNHTGFAVATGNYRNEATFGNYNLLSAGISDCYVINFKETTGTGVNNSTEQNAYVFPNPASEKLSVTIPLNVHLLKVFDGIGRIVIEKEVQPGILTIELSQFQKGIYHLQLTGNNLQYSNKIIVE